MKINYSYNKKGKQPTIIFLHGLGGNLHAWDPITTILNKRGFSTLSIDLRGHGKSERAIEPQEYKIDNFVNDIDKLIIKLKIDNFIVVGHCFGGVVASVYQYKYKKAKLLIMIGSTHKAPKRMRLLYPFMFIANHFILKYIPSEHADERLDFSKFIGTGDYNLLRIASDIKHTSIKSYSATFYQFNNYNGEDILKSIKIPILIISGKKDLVFTDKYAYRICELAKDATNVKIKHANHIMIIIVEPIIRVAGYYQYLRMKTLFALPKNMAKIFTTCCSPHPWTSWWPVPAVTLVSYHLDWFVRDVGGTVAGHKCRWSFGADGAETCWGISHAFFCCSCRKRAADSWSQLIVSAAHVPPGVRMLCCSVSRFSRTSSK